MHCNSILIPYLYDIGKDFGHNTQKPGELTDARKPSLLDLLSNRNVFPPTIPISHYEKTEKIPIENISSFNDPRNKK